MIWCLTMLLALGATSDSAREGGVVAPGEIRVYLADKDGKPVDLNGVTALILIEPEDGRRRMLKSELVVPSGDLKAGLGHGGEVVEMDGYQVELLVVKPHATGDGKDHGEPGVRDATPYFRASVGLEGYACGMKDHPVLDKMGPCPKCSMKVKLVDKEFRAIVIFRIRGDTKNAKGFRYPPVVPGTYEAAVAAIQKHVRAIDRFIRADQNEKAHSAADRIEQICKKLPDMGPEAGKVEIRKACKETTAVFKEIDKAAHAGNKKAALKAVASYKPIVAVLAKHLKGSDQK